MDMMNCFNGMFGKLGAGMCRLTMNGRIAVKTSGGYKSYNVKTGKLTNCSNFVFNIGDDFFFIIPTNKVDVGDIILVKGTPRCVIEVDKKTLCNFTGKWTVKGERVWENDKVVYHFDENVIGYVRFGPYINVFPNDMHVDEVHYGFYVEWPTRPNMRKDIGYWFGTEGMETVVAGNLYD